jgi:hypothetical protein
MKGIKQMSKQKKSKIVTGKTTKAHSVSLSNVVRPHPSFEDWKKAAFDYLHEWSKTKKKYDFLLGDDEDMLPSYNDGESPREYVEYQAECAA